MGSDTAASSGLDRRERLDRLDRLVKPELPERCTVRSQWLAALFIAYSLFIYAGPGLAAWCVWQSHWALWAKLPLMALLLILAQQGLHLLAIVGHEGFHFNLHSDNLVSCRLGIFFSSIVATFLQIGASISHWNHHLHTNREQDPDIQIFRRFNTLLARLAFARTYSNIIYRRNAIAIVRGEPLPYATFLPFPSETVRGLAWLNIACSGLWLAFYAGVLILRPALGFIAIVLPHVLASFYTGIRSYLEHADTTADEFVNARTRTPFLLTVLYFANNYHLEHHLYPWVPCYRLPAVHAYLKSRGYYARAGARIDTTLRAAYKHAGGRYLYPRPFAIDADPSADRPNALAYASEE